MLVALGVLFLLFNIPLFQRTILGETDEDPGEIGARQLVPWLLVVALFPVVTYAVGAYFGERDGIVDVGLQAYVAVCWFPVVKVFLVGKRALARRSADEEPPLIRLFTFLLLLLFAGLIGNAVWVLMRLTLR